MRNDRRDGDREKLTSGGDSRSEKTRQPKTPADGQSEHGSEFFGSEYPESTNHDTGGMEGGEEAAKDAGEDSRGHAERKKFDKGHSNHNSKGPHPADFKK